MLSLPLLWNGKCALIPSGGHFLVDFLRRKRGKLSLLFHVTPEKRGTAAARNPTVKLFAFCRGCERVIFSGENPPDSVQRDALPCALGPLPGVVQTPEFFLQRGRTFAFQSGCSKCVRIDGVEFQCRSSFRPEKISPRLAQFQRSLRHAVKENLCLFPLRFHRNVQRKFVIEHVRRFQIFHSAVNRQLSGRAQRGNPNLSAGASEFHQRLSRRKTGNRSAETDLNAFPVPRDFFRRNRRQAHRCAADGFRQNFIRGKLTVIEFYLIVIAFSDFRLKAVASSAPEPDVQRIGKFEIWRNPRVPLFAGGRFSVDIKSDFPFRGIPGKRQMIPFRRIKLHLREQLALTRSADGQLKHPLVAEVDQITLDFAAAPGKIEPVVPIALVIRIRTEPESDASLRARKNRKTADVDGRHLIVRMTPHRKSLSGNAVDISGPPENPCFGKFFARFPDDFRRSVKRNSKTGFRPGRSQRQNSEQNCFQ